MFKDKGLTVAILGESWELRNLGLRNIIEDMKTLYNALEK